MGNATGGRKGKPKSVPLSADLGEESPSIDQVFRLLKNRRRRLVLAYLGQQGGPVALDELVEYVTVHERDEPESQPDARERRRTHVDLHHCHLPLMEDLGAIDFDESRERIRVGEAFEAIERHLDYGEWDERATALRWNWYFLVLSILGVVLFGVGLVISNPLFTQTVFGVVIAALGACSFLGWRALSKAADQDPESRRTW